MNARFQNEQKNMASGLGFKTLMKGLHRRNSELLTNTKKYKHKKNKIKYKKRNKKLNFKKLSKKELVKFKEKFKRKIRRENSMVIANRVLVTLGIIATLYLLFN